MREIFITQLVKEVLGPHAGIRETLEESPLTEYITGVLAPVQLEARSRDVESEAEIPIEDVEERSEGPADVDVSVPPFLSPPLDPKRRPSSMGLSFVMEVSARPQIRVCLTWARYKITKDGDKAKWEREPRYAVLTIDLDTAGQTIFIDKNGNADDDGQAEISLHYHVRSPDYHVSGKDRRYHVTLYMVNRITVPPNKKLTAEHHIFQPQIRVKCGPGCRIVEGVPESIGKDEETRLEFLYSNRPVLARGYLCSAVWKEIDPEIQLTEEMQLDFPDCRKEPPFAWPDGELLPQQIRNEFTPADVRTEFVPVYCIPSPKLQWCREYGPAPELSADSLAESWDLKKLHNALSPITDGYEKWILSMKRKLEERPDEYRKYRKVAEEIISDCENVLSRMKSGIEVLCTNDDARLAFCFANKAIDVQYRWKNKKSFTWHPFQLAFFLMTAESIVNPESQYRDVCDLLWVPTGAGKTEAYLAVIAFTIAFRRRLALTRNVGPDRTGAGVSVITRYTLRLLTIQQFRRILSVITACELLRVQNLDYGGCVGWRPNGYGGKDNYIWGSTPFRAGLWVGGNVTPNRLGDAWAGKRRVVRGALSILKGKPNQEESEPAQILNCPACDAILAVPEMGLQPGLHTLYLVLKVHDYKNPKALLAGLAELKIQNGRIISVDIFPHRAANYFTLKVQISADDILKSQDIEVLWNGILSHFVKQGCKLDLVPVSAFRPGYFLRYYTNKRGRKKEYDFEIFCPNPNCELHRAWRGGEPMGLIHGTSSESSGETYEFPDGNRPIHVQEAFKIDDQFISDRIPIPALTVDEQLYHRLPTIIVSTVDKFARPPFEPRAASFFGNVDYYHSIWGYYRLHLPPASTDRDKEGHPEPTGTSRKNYKKILALNNPDLILQDELHLIEGPLGSLVGIYETAIDFLCREGRNYAVKYLASTATVKRSHEQVKSVFIRKLQIFPPPGFRVNDRFFVTEYEIHPLDDSMPGRLYVGICAPGRGALTPVVRIWSRLLQTAWEVKHNPCIDTFWTLTGYFNAVRELAGARALYREDIPLRVRDIGEKNPRDIRDDRTVELSSRTSSTELPSILDILEKQFPDSPDALFTTSMFGTGVDIPRIGLMVVHGQPKTTSAYIQSTGRVGRRRGALVVVFYRATRPRDLSHYEFFCGYHRQLHRYVEPVPVYPFAHGVLDKAAGPVAVFILRNMRSPGIPWSKEDTAPLMASYRHAGEVANLPRYFEDRAKEQPDLRRPAKGEVGRHLDSELDRWSSYASIVKELRYVEYAISTEPKSPVVLGDARHRYAKLVTVYEDVPQSLREIEETTGFQTRSDE